MKRPKVVRLKRNPISIDSALVKAFMEIDLASMLIKRQKRVQELLEAWDIMLNSPDFQKLKIKNPVTYSLRVIGRSSNKV